MYQVEPITSIDIQRGQVQLPWEHSSLDSFLANLVESGCDLVEELSRKALLRTLLMDGVLNPVATYVLRFTDPLWFGRIINSGRAWIEAFTGTTDPTLAKKRALSAD